MQPLVVTDLSVSFGARAVLRDLDLTVSPGERVALVGENGTGKSSLLRAIAGQLPGSAVLGGSISVSPDLIRLAQEPPFRDDARIGDVLTSALRPLHEAVAELEALSASLADPAVAERYAERLEWAVAHDAWDATRRAEEAAARLGLDHLDQRRRLDTLSGGQRTRLAMAAAITRRPDVLLLDEPTNHLDDDAIELVTDFLRDLPGVVLFASHDRVFLDDVATALVDLDPSEFGTDGEGGRRFGGGWSAYAEHKRAARARWEQTWAAQAEEIDRLRASAKLGTAAIAHNRGPTDNDKFIHAFKGQQVDKTLARRRRDAERRLAEAEGSQVRKPRPPLEFSAALTGEAAGRISVREVALRGRLAPVSFDLGAGEHLLVTGPNGVGKSSLLGLLSGRLTPDSGTCQVIARRVVELVQDPVLPDPTRSAEAIYRAVVGEDVAERTPLRTLGLIAPSDLNRPAGALSVGQRRRLALATAVAVHPDLLLLDEPTNHLSLALAGELEEALGRSLGTVVIASHDRWLRQHWDGRHVRLGNASALDRHW